MRTDEEDISSCIEVIPFPFGDGIGDQTRAVREQGSPDSTITTSSSYVPSRNLGWRELTADS